MTTTTPNPQIRGPGIQYVASSLSPTHTPPLDEPTFLKWYDTEHLPDIVSTSGMPNAFRAFHVDKTSPYGTRECPRPFFAFYPMPRLEFTQGDEFRTIRIQSEMLQVTECAG
ncbi:hypothetical protein DM02DRAFT_611675 [Periconia macrospinosa]|uniref:EthD domain-containing protein n=1 Tax=Periconia macrospinosa TaxID=97972 RepID=A0A2V1E124_9PLEO|nr:hypothetical protein DM02DRAFT_611675 [Periconia macrospinosa]